MALAERIHRILKMKLDGMMLELINRTGEAARKRRELEEKYIHAREMMAVAAMMEGATGVLLAALSVETAPVYRTTGHKSIFGVQLPDLEPVMVKKTLTERGYGILGTSSVIDDAADAYEDLTTAIIASAELEGGIMRLLDEIERTRRRVNALEFKVIPELADLRRLIVYQRDEIERQDAVRLRRIKKIKAKRR